MSFYQKSFYNLMTSDKKSEKFFKVLHDRMKKAQQETKSTVSVNMSDIGNKPREDKDEPDPGTKGTGPCPLVPSGGPAPARGQPELIEGTIPCRTRRHLPDARHPHAVPDGRGVPQGP